MVEQRRGRLSDSLLRQNRIKAWRRLKKKLKQSAEEQARSEVRLKQSREVTARCLEDLKRLQEKMQRFNERRG